MISEQVNRVNWNDVLDNSQMSKAAIDFSLGVMSGETFKFYASVLGYGGEIRNLVRNRGVNGSRELTRKALKRRNLLNKNNLTNPLVYAQL